MTDARYVTALRFRSLTGIYDPVVRLTTRESNFKQRLLRQANQAASSTLPTGDGRAIR